MPKVKKDNIANF